MYPLSAGIGFISGLTGIGGGVYLSPVLHLTGWGSAKHIAATSSVFILVNSAGSLIIQFFAQDIQIDNRILIFLGAVLAGGLIGSNLSSNVLRQVHVRYITTALVLFASVRVLLKNL